MIFDTFAEGQSALLWSTFFIALVMGAVVNKTNFCTMGAVSDMVNMGDMGRMRAWLLAIAVAVLGVVVLESQGLVDASSSYPPYRQSNLVWLENLLGGLLFGIGMTLASGCGNKTLVRIGGGNIKSIMVFAIIAVIAYFMTNPFPGSDKTLYSELFYGWMSPVAAELSTQQDLGSLIAGDNAVSVRLWVGGVLAVLLMVYAFKSSEFRRNFDNILGGVIVGAAVLGAWYVSSNIGLNIDDTDYTLPSYYSEWDFVAESDEGKPAIGAPLNPQSYTFINPIGQTYGYVTSGLDSSLLTAGIMAVLGVIAGSFLWAILSRGFRFEWFASGKDFLNHFIGAILMGFGGVLAMGCTIGQAVTGISTLAVGSIITFIAIVFGSALTMKIQYYKMLHEDEATFAKALITSLVDMRLLPKGMRKLENM